MAGARSRANWGHTSHVLAMLANVNRNPSRTRPFRADQFNPHTIKRRKGKRVSVAQLTDEIMDLPGKR